MKALTFLLLFFVCCLRAGAPVTISTPGVITLAAGDYAEMLYCSKSTQYAPQIRCQFGATNVSALPYVGDVLAPLKVVGPVEIRLDAQAGVPAFATFSVSRAGDVPSVTPSNAVVIPSDATGNFQVILESSTDLITWTAANPGNYSGTTEKRFFRTRVVKL